MREKKEERTRRCGGERVIFLGLLLLLWFGLNRCDDVEQVNGRWDAGWDPNVSGISAKQHMNSCFFTEGRIIINTKVGFRWVG